MREEWLDLNHFTKKEVKGHTFCHFNILAETYGPLSIKKGLLLLNVLEYK